MIQEAFEEASVRFPMNGSPEDIALHSSPSERWVRRGISTSGREWRGLYPEYTSTPDIDALIRHVRDLNESCPGSANALAAAYVRRYESNPMPIQAGITAMLRSGDGFVQEVGKALFKSLYTEYIIGRVIDDDWLRMMIWQACEHLIADMLSETYPPSDAALDPNVVRLRDVGRAVTRLR